MKLHLINNDNLVVRTFNQPENAFYVIRHQETRRIEIVQDLEVLKQNQVPFELLQKFDSRFESMTEAKTAVLIKGTTLRLVHSADEYMKDVTLNKDNPELYSSIQKKTAVTGLVILAMGFLASQFLPKTETVEPEMIPQVVRIIEKPQTVSMVEDSRQLKPVQQKVVQPKTVRPNSSSKKSASTVSKKSEADYLNFLGDTNDKRLRPGLEVSKAQVKSAGVGLGGSQGSGGVQTTQFGKGFFKKALGPGHNPNGQGGYGTRGAGGGKAGYGSLSIVGSGGTSLLEGLDNEATFEGGLGRDQISAVIHRHINEVRFCYEKGLVGKPNLNGKVAIHFLINPNGKVSTAEVKHSSLNESQVENCIRNRLRTWAFPKPVGGVNVKVTYPFVLKKLQDT